MSARGRTPAADPAPIYQLKADFFRLLGHPARVRILELLREGERSVGELQLALGLDSSGTSQHLTAMRKQGLLESRRAGTSVFYSVKDPRMFQLLEVAKQVLTAQLEDSTALLGDLGTRVRAVRSAEARLGLHVLQECSDVREPGAIGRVVLGASATTDVGPERPVVADGSDRAGQSDTPVLQRNQRARRIRPAGEEVVDRNAEDLVGTTRVAVVRTPPADGQAGPLTHAMLPCVDPHLQDISYLRRR